MAENKHIELAENKFNIKVKKIDNVPESYSSKVYKLTLTTNDRVVLKIPYSITKYQREIYGLNKLEDKLPVPKILDTYTTKNYGMVLLSYINGNPLEGAIDKKMAYDMGNLLATLHINEVPTFGDLTREESTYNNWWELMKNTYDKFIPYFSQIVSLEEMVRMEKTFHILYSQLPSPDGPCFVHMDYRPGNILVNNNSIVGLIDFESTRGGSSDIDLTKIKHYVWDRYKGTKSEFLAGYSQIRKVPDLSITLPFYTFVNTFSSIGWCVKSNKLNRIFLKDNLTKLKALNKKYGR